MRAVYCTALISDLGLLLAYGRETIQLFLAASRHQHECASLPTR